MNARMFEYAIDQNGDPFVFCVRCGADVTEVELNQHTCDMAKVWERAERDQATMTAEEWHERWTWEHRND